MNLERQGRGVGSRFCLELENGHEIGQIELCYAFVTFGQDRTLTN